MAVHLADRGEDIVCVGSGFDRHAELFDNAPWAQLMGPASAFPSAVHGLTLAVHRIAADSTSDAYGIEPMYLRAPDAEINWKSREATS
ncbi:unannotated protein [freshwater metagenome]